MDIPTFTHLEQLRGQLRSLRRELRGERVAPARADSRDATDISDFKDLAGDASALRVDEIRELRELSALDAVDAALQRMETGTYGDCCDCGEPIGLARLQSLPMATRCTACQQQLEDDLHWGRTPASGSAQVHPA